MAEYSDFKPCDDWGQSKSDEDDFLANSPAYGPSVPPSYPAGFRDEADMGREYRAWTPREDWARGAREHFDEESIDLITIIGEEPDEGATPDYVASSPYQNITHVHDHPHSHLIGVGHRGLRVHGDELEGEP